MTFAAALFCAGAFLLPGCGSANGTPILDAEAELAATSRKIEHLAGVRVANIDYTETTKEALADLQPTEGMPFRLSGFAELEITEDLTRTVDTLSAVDPEIIRHIREAVQRYQISPDPLQQRTPTPAEQMRQAIGSEPTNGFPRSYVTQFKKGDRQTITWTREVQFYQSADTGQLASRVIDVQVTSVSEPEVHDLTYDPGYDHLRPFQISLSQFHQGLSTSTDGYDVRDPKGLEGLNQYFQQYLDELIAEENRLFSESMKVISSLLSKDAVFTDGYNYFRLTTPNISSEFFTGDPAIKNQLIPCQFAWIDAAGSILVTTENKFGLAEVKRQADGEYAVRFNSKEISLETQIPQLELPSLIDYKSFVIGCSSSDGHYALSTLHKQLEFVCWADYLDAQSLKNSELVQTFQQFKAAQQFVESRPLLCQFSTRRGEQYSMAMRIKRDADAETGVIVTTNLATGLSTTWKIDDIRYIRGQGIIIYEADRVGDRILKAHEFDRDNDLRFDLHADGQIEFYGYKNSKTTEFKE